MKKILSVDNMRASDAATIAGGIPGRELMWRAGEAIYEVVLKEHGWQGKTGIVCGSGNNAGDGYVLALLLKEAGYECELYLTTDRFSEDGEYYFKQCIEKEINNVDITSCNTVNISSLKECEIIVDCIYGTGFHGTLKTPIRELISKINELSDKVKKKVDIISEKGVDINSETASMSEEKGVYIISIDINSGLNGANGMADLCVHSDLTISIGDYQPGHFLNMAKDVMKKHINCPIGIEPVEQPYYLFEESDAAAMFPDRKNMSNKGTYGYIALVGGSSKYSGAIRLANMAAVAMRCGAGVVTVAAPCSLHNIIATHMLESTFYPMDDNDGELIYVPEQVDELINHKKAIAFGMGIGKSEQTANILRHILEKYEGNLIIDADGISDLSDIGSDILLKTRAKVILTPHLGEMSRLTGLTIAQIQQAPIETAMEYAKKYQVTVLLKGPSTIVTNGTAVYITNKGCPGMATAGSGDVLSGIIGAIAGSYENSMGIADLQDDMVSIAGSQNSLVSIAASAALINGMAGEKASERYGDISMIASDTASCIAEVIQKLIREGSEK